MSNKNIILTSSEQNSLTEILLTEKTDRIKHNREYETIDSVLSKVSDRVTYVKKQSPHISLFNGTNHFEIHKGGILQSEHGKFTVQDIKDQSIKVNGRWHHKSEFEPAFVLKEKGRDKGIQR